MPKVTSFCQPWAMKIAPIAIRATSRARGWNTDCMRANTAVPFEDPYEVTSERTGRIPEHAEERGEAPPSIAPGAAA
jgi:hypothetical protein